MNSRNMILSGALIALVMLVTTNVFFSSAALAVPVSSGVNLNAGLEIFTIKKIAYICDSGASAPASQNPPEIGGCVDDNFGSNGGTSGVSSGNASDIRFNQYLFTGEVLDELVAARDLSGAQFLASTASLYVDGASMVTCSDVTSGVSGHGTLNSPSGPTAYNFNGDTSVGSLLQIMPAAFGVNDPTGFNTSYDKLYDCKITVTDSMQGSPSSVYAVAWDTLGNNVSTDVQKWYFNPAISISVSFDSGTSIQFPSAQAGQTVFSTNTMIIKNTAAGGVDLVTYLTGNDLTDTTGQGLCPSSNTLNINDMSYRCLVDSMQSEVFTPLSHLKENNGCTYGDPTMQVPTQCDVQDNWNHSNLILPDAPNSAFSIIANGHQAQCWFQLNVPFPCLGQYSATNAVDVLVRAL